MTNENCLHGIQCPACGNKDTFRIAVTTMATVTDDGAEVTHGDMTWNDGSHAECVHCDEQGPLSHFKARSESSSESPPPKQSLFDTLLDIKRLASKHNDNGYCPYTALELIEMAIVKLTDTKGADSNV